MDDKSEAEVSSSMMTNEKEEPESTTGSTNNTTSSLDLDEEPPTKSPKTEEGEAEPSIEMAPEVSSTSTSVPMTPEVESKAVVQPETDLQEVQQKSDEDGDANQPAQSSTTEQENESPDSEEPMSISEPEPEVLVELRVIYNKQPMPVQISLKRTVFDLKKIIEKTTKVTPELMKVLVKGAKDDLTLESIGLSNGSKVLVIGTPLEEVIAVAKAPTAKELSSEEPNGAVESLNWCAVPRHKKVIDKGIPDDVMAGISGENEALPPFPLFGMLSSKGAKVRLTFKLEADELWIGTKERTEKVPISTIRAVVTQPIVGFEHYHIVAIQMGPTEASRYFVYWVPCQYVNAIKSVLGS